MKSLYNAVDPDGLLEYSVVYTDRALNHMSHNFQSVMRDVSSTLKTAYNAHRAIVVPGSGTFGMEAVARQFTNGQSALVLRNGWFSYRWSQIFEMGNFTSSTTVLMAQRPDSQAASASQQAFAPAAIEQVIATIENDKPAMVYAPHVETSAGMMLPDSYIKAVAEATHKVGGLFVLDCIASGCMWVDMKATGVDVVISAPQKGWSGPPCCGLVMLSEQANEKLQNTDSNSFAIDLKKWSQIMEAYESGAHAYHSTMPTESLRQFRDVMQETVEFGLDNAKQAQHELGTQVRALLAQKGFKSVASAGFEAPGVVVCFTDNPNMQNGSAFAKIGMQIAAGVPLMCDEGEDFKSFRIGLFGLDKLKDVERSVQSLAGALNQLPVGEAIASV